LEQVEPNEDLTRYIFGKDYYRPKDKTVKHNAFMPAKEERKVSVYRISSLPLNEVWDIGDCYVAPLRNKPVIGRADILALHVIKQGLKIAPEDDPHPRHANIVDWPEEREKQRMIALELADEAELHLRN
jgi:hypothetical protein